MRLSLLLGVAGVATLLSPVSAQRPAVDQAFPVLTFPELGSKELASIARCRGKKLLLIQFASW